MRVACKSPRTRGEWLFAQGGFDRREQLLRFVGFFEEICGAEFFGSFAQARLFTRGHENKGRRLGKHCLNSIRDLKPVARWQRDIEQGEIGLGLDCAAYTQHGIGSYSYFLAGGRKANRQSLRDTRVVFDDEDFFHRFLLLVGSVVFMNLVYI